MEMKKNIFLLLSTLFLSYGFITVNNDIKQEKVVEARTVEHTHNVAFKSLSGTTDGSSKVSTMADIVDTDEDSIIKAVGSTSNVYQGKSGYGIKLGSGSSTGSITLTLNKSYDISKIVVRAIKYGSDSGNIKINGTPINTTLNSTETEITREFATPSSLSSIVIATSSKRAYVLGFSFTWSEEVADTYNITYTNTDGIDTSAYPIQYTEGTGINSLPVPEKDGYNFLGWYDNADFTGNVYTSISSTASSNIDLYAKWEEINLDDPQQKINQVESFFTIGYAYTDTVVTNKVTDTLDLSTTKIANGTTSYSSWTSTSSNGVTYNGNSAGDKNSIQLRSKNNESGIIASSPSKKLDKVSLIYQSDTTSGRKVDVYGSNTAYTEPSNLYSDGTKGTLLGSLVFGGTTELKITGNYKYIGIRSNDGALYLTSISFVWGTENHTYSNCDFRFKVAVDKTKMDEIKGENSFGLVVYTGTKEVSYTTSNGLKVDEDDNKYYVLLDLGDVINNSTRAETVFTVKAFMTVGGTTYTSTNTLIYKSFSVKSLVDYYLANAVGFKLTDDQKEELTALQSILNG